MARGRFISKKISESGRVNDLPILARLLYTWMIPHLDRDGRMVGDAVLVKNKVIPYVDVSIKTVESYLKQMHEAKSAVTGYGLITRYKVGNHWYICMEGFRDEQLGLVYSREPKSDIPPPPEHKQKTETSLLDDSELATQTKKASFEDYIEELRAEFADLNFDEEFKKFNLYWEQKTLKNPKLALRNWMNKARDIQSQRPETKSARKPIAATASKMEENQ